jgi:Ser/Thr protein kinase RdoA (MazF antagonist)
MPGLYDDNFVEILRGGAQSVVGQWGFSTKTRVSLLAISENATFRADDPRADAPAILRVHRPGYHTRAEIESELDWIEALRTEGVVEIPAPLPCTEGAHITGFDLEGETRDVVAFEFMVGEEPSQDDDLVSGFHELGAISARLHAHARSWERPSGFTRKTWNFETTVGSSPHWGDWRAGLGLDERGRKILERVCVVLERRLVAYGEGAEHFGLIHADLRLANLLVDEAGRIGVIDFDDCGFGWFMYDFAAAVSFFEYEPIIPSLREAWVRGYKTVRELALEHIEMLPTFVMLRRLLLTAWIASHSETPTAQALGAGYTDGTVALGEQFLRNAD